jgi:hypothetical protein
MGNVENILRSKTGSLVSWTELQSTGLDPGDVISAVSGML